MATRQNRLTSTTSLEPIRLITCGSLVESRGVKDNTPQCLLSWTLTPCCYIPTYNIDTTTQSLSCSWDFCHVRIQGWDPLGGGSRDKETGEAPHGHGHWCPLGEVGQGQQHPVSHHRGLACGMECLENLEVGAEQRERQEKGEISGK